MRLLFAFQHCRYTTVGWAVVKFFQNRIIAYWKNIILYHEIHQINNAIFIPGKIYLLCKQHTNEQY